MSNANFSIEAIQNRPEAKIIHLKGEIDENNLGEIEEFLTPLIQDEVNKIFVFNLAELEFINSKAIGYLNDIHNQLQASSRRMILAEYNETIQDIIALVGMDQIIDHYPTTQEALTHL